MSTPSPVPPDMPEIPGIPAIPADAAPVPVEPPGIPPMPLPLPPEPPVIPDPVMPPPQAWDRTVSPPIPEATAHRPPGPPPMGFPPVSPLQASMGGGTKVLLSGCVGIVVLVVLGLGAGVWWVGKKVKGFADNPEQFVTEMVLSQHPELELVKVDKVTKQVTLKDRKTGETTIVSFSDIEQGKFSVKKSDGSSVEMDSAGITTRDKDGNETVVGGRTSLPLPAWVPLWQGEHKVVMSSRKVAGGQVSGDYGFTTAAVLDEAAPAYQKQLEAAGFTVETEELTVPQGRVFNLTATSGEAGAERSVRVNCIAQGEGTVVTMDYSGPAQP